MIVNYNSVDLQAETVSIDQEAIYNGPDYLYTRALVSCRAVWAQTATAADADAGKMNAAASMNAGNLRRSLLTPRKPLRVGVPADGTYAIATDSDGLNVVVQTPGLRAATKKFTVDVKDGPFPRKCDIVSILGDGTMIVDFVIETYFIECTDARAILSNRWTMTHDLDEDYWTTRQIQGVAHFRADYLAANNRVPDDYRSSVIIGVADRFKRIGESVAQSEDGLQLQYVVVDREQPQSINPAYRRITRIEGYYQEADSEGDVNTQSLIGQSLGAIQQTALANAITPQSTAAGTSIPGTAVASNFGLSSLAITAGIGAAVQSSITYPETNLEFAMTVYGSRIATRNDLINALARAAAAFNFQGTINLFGMIGAAAGGIANNLLLGELPGAAAGVQAAFENAVRGNLSCALQSKAIKFDLWNRTATIFITARVSMTKAAVLQGMGLGLGVGNRDIQNLANAGGLFDNIPGKVGGQSVPLTTTGAAATTNPPFDNGTRGLRYSRLESAEPTGACDTVRLVSRGIPAETAADSQAVPAAAPPRPVDESAIQNPAQPPIGGAIVAGINEFPPRFA